MRQGGNDNCFYFVSQRKTIICKPKESSKIVYQKLQKYSVKELGINRLGYSRKSKPENVIQAVVAFEVG